ncbi:hypothetical protein GGI17_006152 [Coemansia sp. S146]|nr:hypothetical protein GGI17_006152 [Coemansia sp. S146]
MFIQKAGQFNPHPDFSDPHLISSRIPLVQWSVSTSKLVDTKLVIPDEERAWELLGINSAAWAIVIENNVYSSNDIPSYLQVTYGSKDTATYGTFGFIGVLLMPGLAITALIAANLDDMAFAPWTVLSRLISKTCRQKASPDVARSSSAQQLALSAEGQTELDSAETSTTSNPYFRHPEAIAAISRSIDRGAMRWIHLLSIPIIAVIALYILVLQEDRLLSLGFSGNVVARSTHIFFFVAWLPQIIVNYKAKSGSLTPVIYSFLMLGSSVLLAVFNYLMGHASAMDVVVCIPISVCHVIIIVQRIMYLKRAKQE